MVYAKVLGDLATVGHCSYSGYGYICSAYVSLPPRLKSDFYIILDKAYMISLTSEVEPLQVPVTPLTADKTSTFGVITQEIEDRVESYEKDQGESCFTLQCPGNTKVYMDTTCFM